MKKRSPEEARNRINRLSEGLFGVPDDISVHEAESQLAEEGIDVEELQDRLYQRLYQEAQSFWKESKDPPPLLKQALSELRPLTARPRSEQELHKQAQTIVERIVERAKFIGSLLPSSAPQFAESYRNKKGLSEEDRKKLDQVKSDLTNKIESLREKK